jgi:hypothetical protein
VIPLYRLYRFNRRSGTARGRAFARAWETWRRDPFATHHRRARVIGVVVAAALVFFIAGALLPHCAT